MLTPWIAWRKSTKRASKVSISSLRFLTCTISNCKKDEIYGPARDQAHLARPRRVPNPNPEGNGHLYRSMGHAEPDDPRVRKRREEVRHHAVHSWALRSHRRCAFHRPQTQLQGCQHLR